MPSLKERGAVSSGWTRARTISDTSGESPYINPNWFSASYEPLDGQGNNSFAMSTKFSAEMQENRVNFCFNFERSDQYNDYGKGRIMMGTGGAPNMGRSLPQMASLTM